MVYFSGADKLVSVVTYVDVGFFLTTQTDIRCVWYVDVGFFLTTQTDIRCVCFYQEQIVRSVSVGANSSFREGFFMLFVRKKNTSSGNIFQN